QQFPAVCPRVHRPFRALGHVRDRGGSQRALPPQGRQYLPGPAGAHLALRLDRRDGDGLLREQVDSMTRRKWMIAGVIVVVLGAITWANFAFKRTSGTEVTTE